MTQIPPYQVKNNGLAVASLVTGICGFICLVPAILGIVFGLVAINQIRNSGGTQSGEGMATAGIICGIAWLGLIALYYIIIIGFAVG